jgi:hypothetical protein
MSNILQKAVTDSPFNVVHFLFHAMMVRRSGSRFLFAAKRRKSVLAEGLNRKGKVDCGCLLGDFRLYFSTQSQVAENYMKDVIRIPYFAMGIEN